MTGRELARWNASHSRPAEGCWEWIRQRRTDVGYGRFFYQGKVRLAHRFSYEMHVGPIPSGYELDHLCRNRACIRPDHLEPVTHSENARRGMVARGLTAKVPPRPEPKRKRGPNLIVNTHCRKGHEYTDENTYRVPNRRGNPRRCRICLRMAQEKERAKFRPLAWAQRVPVDGGDS